MANITVWLKGFLAAALGGAVTGFSQATTSNGGHVTSGTGIVAGVGALATALAYILQSPRKLNPTGADPAPADTKQ